MSNILNCDLYSLFIDFYFKSHYNKYSVGGVFVLSTERLKSLRREKNYKQIEVANVLGVGRTTYAKYETGGIQPPNDILVNIAKIFNVSVDYLLNVSDDPKSPDKKEKAPSAETEREKDLKYLSEKIRELEINDLIKVDDYIDLLIHRHNK